jgi:Domain of unknown function (DUF3883)
VPEDWSRFEVEAIVADYFAMAEKERHGESVNKAEHNRLLQPLLNNRSRAAIEFKHANISAALLDLGFPYLDGYKPRVNYQDLVREVIVERLAADIPLQTAMERIVDQPVQTVPEPGDLSTVIVPAPTRGADRAIHERPTSQRRPLTINYLEREAMNRSLGLAGEQYVLRLEHSRLWQAGQNSLADRVEHVSRTQGDGLGYDILSFDEDGRERLIEVKTTRFGSMTPFFASRNEVKVSEDRGVHYQLYRVFKFEEPPPKVFILPGSLRKSCRLDPVLFSASVL